MNKLTLENKRDFPITTNTLKFMQDAYALLEKLAAIGGDNYIVSGCVVTGSSVSTGYMVLKGQLMPFKAGSVTSNVQIVETKQTITVEGGSREETSYQAEFGTSSNSANNVTWASIKRINTVLELMTELETLSQQLTNDVSALNNRITNETASLNTKITDEVSTLNGRITNEVSTLNTRITNEVNALTQSISNNSQSISGISNRVDALEADTGWLEVTTVGSGVSSSGRKVYVRQRGNHVIVTALFYTNASGTVSFDLPAAISAPTITTGFPAVNGSYNIAQMAILENTKQILANTMEARSGQYCFNFSYYV